MLKQISVALGPPGPDPVSIFFSEVKSQVLTACYSLYPTNVDIPSKVDSLFLALAAQVELEQKVPS